MTHRPRPQEQLVAAEAARGPLALDEQYAVVSVRHSRAQLPLRSPPEPALPRPRSSPHPRRVCRMVRAEAAAGGGGSATRGLCAGRSRSADEQRAETPQPAPTVHLFPF